MFKKSAAPEEQWHEDTEVAAGPSPYTYVPDSDAEKALVRRIDRRIVPTIWVLYTLSYLDRANIANAKVGGMEEALQLTSTQYSVILLLFFVSYVLFEVPSNMILTRCRPSIYLSVLCFLWGGVAAVMAACNTWKALAGVRFALGVIEAGFAPGVAFFLSSWYKKHELAKRYSIYYTATAVSGAFSGLLAGVITDKLRDTRGIQGWQWLLLIEGVASCFAACFTWYILPDWPSTTKWLSAEERFIAVERLRHDGIGNAGGANQPTHGQAAKMAFTDWRVWMLVVMYMLATGSQTIQYFIPTLVGQLGYTGYTKQYMTIPIYVVALIFILAFCFASDICKERGHFISAAACLSGICFIITVSVNNEHVKYGFLCLAVGGVYAACPLTLLWVSKIIAYPAEKRAVSIALVNALGNSASIYGSFLWPAATGPRFVQGFGVTTAFVLLLAVLAQVNRFLVAKYPGEAFEDVDPTAKGVSANTGHQSADTVSEKEDASV